MEGDEPVIEEVRETDNTFLRRRYNSVAEEHPVVQEITDGLTSFGEALDEIIADLANPPDNDDQSAENPMGMFIDYVEVMEALTGEELLGYGARRDVTNYETGNSKEIKGLVKKILGIGTGGSTASLIAGLLLKNEWARLILQSIGVSGLTTTGCIGLWYGTKQGIYTLKAKKHFKPLYEIADRLDAEVVEAFYDYIDTVEIGDDEIEIKWADCDEEFDQYTALVEAKGNMDTSTLYELHPQHGEHLLVLAKAGDVVIGGAGLVEVKKRTYLDSFIVDEEWRNRGVGTAMVDEIFEHCVIPSRTLAAIVASYVGINKKKFQGMGFDLLYRKDALEQGLPYKDDDYAMRPKNKSCSLFLRPKDA